MYGIDAHHGGDSPENMAKMRKCVIEVIAEDASVSKEQAAAICMDILFSPEHKPVRKKRTEKHG